MYAHGKQKPMLNNRADPFFGRMDEQKKAACPVLTRAKKRILQAVQGMHDGEDQIWSDHRSPDLTQTSICARRLKEYIDSKFWPVPEFLESAVPSSKESNKM
jgi:hypothetical protein